MNNDYTRWGGSLPTNSKELRAQYKGRGCGGSWQDEDKGHSRFVFKVKAEHMRTRLQRRLDNDPFFKRLNQKSSKAEIKRALAAQPKSPTFLDAMGVMMSSIGAALDLTDFFGHVSTKAGLRVALPKLMGKIGIMGSVLGIRDNIKQIHIEGFNWNDVAQVITQTVVVGMALVVMAGGSAVLVPIISIGGMTLFAWELAESHFGW